MTKQDRPKHSKLSDNPTAQLLPSLFQHAESIRRLIELLQEQGVEHEVLNHLLLGAEYTLENADYVDVAERFNQTFADRGWIATESFCVDTMRKSLIHHDDQHCDESEDVIVEWFNEIRIQLFAIGRCGYFGDHNLRKDQLEEALELTQEEHYISAIPLILIACEGFAKDVLRVDLFSKDSDLTAFDSFVGHESALPKLVRALTQTVKETSESTSDLPLRHGILHGKTLGYATKSNCMKAWLLFIALTDLHIERLREAETPSDATLPDELNVEDVALMLLERGKKQARLRG